MSAIITICWILGSNLIFSFIFSLVIYLLSLKYYRPLIKKDKDNNPIDLHKKYDAFHPHDQVLFIQLWLGAFFCALIKIFSSLFILTFCYLNIRILKKMYKNYDTNHQQRKKMKHAISFWSWMFLFMNGVRIKRKYPEYKDAYKKYLGEDYDFSDDKYSLLTSNHIGFFEVVLCMALYSPGFMAKKDIENYLIIGPISSAINCLYVDRECQKDKKKIFDLLLSRQKSFYEEKILSPLMMFPEGTCSCGRNILRFKKGAFYSLLPIKPQIVSVNQKAKYHLSVGASNVILAYFKNACHFINIIYVAILPTIRPTDYMFEKYKDKGKEKWEIYSYVVRKIYSEVGGLIEIDMGLRDLKRYIKAQVTGFYDPNENMNFEKEEKIVQEEENRNINESVLELNIKQIKENNNFDNNKKDEEKVKIKEDKNREKNEEINKAKNDQKNNSNNIKINQFKEINVEIRENSFKDKNNKTEENKNEAKEKLLKL